MGKKYSKKKEKHTFLLVFTLLSGNMVAEKLFSPSRVLVELRAKVSSFSKVSPTSSHAAAKLGFNTF
jgi:hypothetical protein